MLLNLTSSEFHMVETPEVEATGYLINVTGAVKISSPSLFSDQALLVHMGKQKLWAQVSVELPTSVSSALSFYLQPCCGPFLMVMNLVHWLKHHPLIRTGHPLQAWGLQGYHPGYSVIPRPPHKAALLFCGHQTNLKEKT